MEFRNDFIWGTATAAYQIEGAYCEDGRGLSVWDTFCKEEGKVFDGHNGDVACDHYHRYKEDIKLLKKLGIDAYRFSISWTRILPDGTGRVNAKGIEFYSNLIDELIENGITPYATLFHWDYPNELFNKNGWLNPDSSEWFEEYTTVVAKAFGDKLKNYFTLNEPQCFIDLGYNKGIHAPGLKLSRKELLLMSHNVLLAHGKSVKILRELVPGCSIGYAPTGTFYYPETPSEENIKAARMATFNLDPKDFLFSVSFWSDPIVLGKYTDGAIDAFGDDMPPIGQNDMETICQPIDFYGQNIYFSTPVVADGDSFKVVNRSQGHTRTANGWPVTPQCLYWAPKFIYEKYKTPIIVTENGLSCHDTISLDGHVHDYDRIDYLLRHLKELSKAASDGVDIKGYFHWSFMDNFEWADGYRERFGLVYVDYGTLERIPKESFWRYMDIINKLKNGQKYSNNLKNKAI